MSINSIEDLINVVKSKNKDEPQFIQAFEEVVLSLKPVFTKNPKYLKVMERLAEPERSIIFRVPWIDDKGEIQVNRGYRVQYNSAIGPYKGGIRFHPSVNLSIMKFLGFEQILKNALTSLPMGGGKGGSDFDPKGKSDNEIMRFCQSFMTELNRHIGPNTDVPAGDIGVGATEIGYLFGQYKRLRNEWSGVLTGKGQEYGGSLVRPEATGYGIVWYAREVLAHYKKELKGQKCLVSGSGNVAQYCAEMLIELGAHVITMSDSNGYILEPNGLTKKQLDQIMEIKNVKKGRISEYTKLSETAKYFDKKRPWEQPADIAFPCATQNEIELVDAENLIKGKVWALIEGANMPCTNDAIALVQKHKLMFAPAKAANAGGVACSGLEMSQNSIRIKWDREEVKEKLQTIMKNIYKACYQASKDYGDEGNLQLGANAAGFDKVAKAMIAQGCV